jgi:hypothetical protein
MSNSLDLLLNNDPPITPRAVMNANPPLGCGISLGSEQIVLALGCVALPRMAKPALLKGER